MQQNDCDHKDFFSSFSEYTVTPEGIMSECFCCAAIGHNKNIDSFPTVHKERFYRENAIVTMYLQHKGII